MDPRVTPWIYDLVKVMEQRVTLWIYDIVKARNPSSSDHECFDSIGEGTLRFSFKLIDCMEIDMRVPRILVESLVSYSQETRKMMLS